MIPLNINDVNLVSSPLLRGDGSVPIIRNHPVSRPSCVHTYTNTYAYQLQPTCLCTYYFSLSQERTLIAKHHVVLDSHGDVGAYGL